VTALPFGTEEILAAVAGAPRVLDAACGSGRLTVELARTGADVTGFDTNARQLDVARRRATEEGVALTLLEADFNGALPFPDGAFDAVVSRLALMAADDAVATLRELARVLEPGGRLVTVLWAAPEENPWFGAPREAIRTVLGTERGAFARAFGKMGSPQTATETHRRAGLADIEATYVRGTREAPDAATWWRELSAENGHFRRVAESIDDAERGALVAEIERRLAPYEVDGRLLLPRALVLVTARR
jgi:SAM-dependent methyltransferase